MATRDVLIQQVRFALEQLSARNGHHEFEKICEHLARATICQNILPATGPVSSQGDQGRDFETFRTYIEATELRKRAFIGRIPEGSIVFVCTIQQKGIRKKIRDDVDSVMKSGVHPEAVYAFLTNDLPVGERHKIQTWASKTHDVHLEILDGQAVSTELSVHEQFWIAQQYLKIPSEIQPDIPPEAIKDWYRKAKEKWDGRELPLPTPANFYELAAAARTATQASDLRSDLSSWIERLDLVRSSWDIEPDLLRRATYEAAVASLKGLNTLHGREQQLREYFDVAVSTTSPSELEDCLCLINYCRVAYLRDAVSLDAEYLELVHARLVAQLDSLIADADSVTLACYLLEIRGNAELIPQGALVNPRLPDADAVLSYWNRMLSLVHKAPLYPLERFADRVTGHIGLIGDASAYRELTERTDKLLSERFGGFAAADKSRDRAIAFHKAGRLVRTINELHKAKVDWFAEETIRGALMSMLLLGETYLELGLAFAAKQYALAVADLAFRIDKPSVRRYVPDALRLASSCDHQQGNWIEFISWTSKALYSHHLVPSQHQEEDRMDEQLNEVVYNVGMLLFVAGHIAPDIGSQIEQEISQWELDELFDEFAPLVDEFWGEKSLDRIWESLEDQLSGRPFSDVSQNRVIEWQQLGLTWQVSCTNSTRAVALAEQFCAIAQIVMADWSGRDMAFLRTSIKIEIELADERSEGTIESMPSNKGREWVLRLPEDRPEVEFEIVIQETLAHLLVILSEVSLLPDQDLRSEVDRSFEDGLSGKIMVSRPYCAMYEALIGEPRLFDPERLEWDLPEKERSFALSAHSEMKWFDGPGPGYEKNASFADVQRRYDKGIRVCRHTLPRLREEPEFNETVARLRKSGWLDWHLLLAITNIIVDYRVIQPAARLGGRPPELSKLMFAEFEKEEDSGAPLVPVSEFSEEAMRRTLMVTQTSTLVGSGLQLRQKTPDVPAIEHFLGKRFGYWSDDVEHPELFDT